MRNQNRLSDKEVSLSIDILESVLNWYKGLSAVRKLNAKQEKYLEMKDGKTEAFRCGCCNYCKNSKILNEDSIEIL